MTLKIIPLNVKGQEPAALSRNFNVTCFPRFTHVSAVSREMEMETRLTFDQQMLRQMASKKKF